MRFPSFPRNSADIYNFAGPGEYMACTIVKRTDTRQLMAFRNLRLKLGEQRFREALVEAIDIIDHSTGIKNPAGWLYWFLNEEATHVR